MMIKKNKMDRLRMFFCLGILFSQVCSCNNKELDENINDPSEKIGYKDTLVFDDVVEDLSWKTINLQYFDKKGNLINGIANNNDTFFVKVSYKSEKFKDLSKNCSIELKAISDNVIINESKDKFELIVRSKYLKDTIEYNMYMKSNKYIFKTQNNKSETFDKIPMGSILATFDLTKR